jgi:hypothetical protein
MRSFLVALLLLCTLLGAGCHYMSFLLYTIAPERKITHKAEFAGLKGQKIAVIVYADPGVLFEYGGVRYELANFIGLELLAKVEGSQVIDPARIVLFQDSNLYWDTMPMPEIGRQLNADYVLYVSLEEFSTHESGSTTLGRGRVTAQVSLWRSRPDAASDGCVWRKDSLSVLHPKAGPVVPSSGRDEAILLLQTETMFAEDLVKSFYDYKVPESEEAQQKDE